jgi:hypothetical protein
MHLIGTAERLLVDLTPTRSKKTSICEEEMRQRHGIKAMNMEKLRRVKRNWLESPRTERFRTEICEQLLDRPHRRELRR